MPTEFPHRVLVVANRTASTPAMLGEVQRRARTGARFALLIPPTPDADGRDWSADDARDLLGRAGAGDVELVDPGADAALRVHQLIAAHEYDEVILSTPHHHLERWRHHDLPHRLRDLDVPVTAIPPEPDSWGPIEGFPPEWTPHAASPAAIAGFGNY
jgi:hypothetical protein